MGNGNNDGSSNHTPNVGTSDCTTNGESQAIKIITSQLKQSPEYLQWLSINRWNGQMPYALGSGAFPFFQLPSATMHQNQSNSS